MLLATAGPSTTPSVTQLLSQSTLSSSQSAPPPPPPHNLTATVVTKPPPILSVRAFNTQLVVGGKDRALRRAADLFKAAAENMEAGRARSERYWLDALRIRRGNWGLVPAPLPPGSATGKGADKTSKDFLVSFGLEEGMCIRHRAGAMLTFPPSARGLPASSHWSHADTGHGPEQNRVPLTTKHPTASVASKNV